MRTSVIVLVAAVAVLLIPGGQALADTASKAAMAAFEKRFEEMDTNGDGKIDRTEYVDYEIKKAKDASMWRTRTATASSPGRKPSGP